MRNTTGGSRLEGGSHSSVCLVACRVTGAFEHLCSRPSGGVDTVAKAAGGHKQILSAFGARSDVPVSILRIGPGSQQLDDDPWGRSGELVDRPHAHRRLAKLGDDGGRIRISGSKFLHQLGSPCDEVLEGSVIQARHVHGSAV